MAKRSASTCIRIASLGSSFEFFDAEICEYTLNRCMDESNAFESFKNMELEQLSRIIGMSISTSTSAIKMAVGKAILQELRNRVNQITNREFHQHFVFIQWNLTMKDIYDMELLENTLRKDYVHCMYFRCKQKAPIYCLHAYARLNLASIYEGDTLSEEHLENLGKMLSTYYPNREIFNEPDVIDDYFPTEELWNKPAEGFLGEVSKCVKSLFEHFTYAQALSHFRQPDIFVGIDKTTGKAVDVSHLFPPEYTGQLIWARQIVRDDPNLELYAFVTVNTRMFDVETGRGGMGGNMQKLQQLNLLGFHTVFVSRIRLRNIKFLTDF